MFFAYMAPTQIFANGCGDGKLNAETCEKTHFTILTPQMVGINGTKSHISVNNYDVSKHFGLKAGSVLVTFSSVDVIKKKGTLAFFLAGDGDNHATWSIKYSMDKAVRVAHGGALAGREDDIFISKDSTGYKFEYALENGLSHKKSGNTYKVHNSRKKKINNDKAFTWTSNSAKKSFSFDLKTTADSRSGKGSKYTIFIDDSVCNKPTTEQCDDGNTNNNDGCTDQCKVELGYVCKEDASTDWESMYDYGNTCKSTGRDSVVMWHST